MILQRDQETLQTSQGPKRNDQNQRDPERSMDPIGRLILCFDDQGGSHDDSAGDHDDEYGRPVARIGKAEIEPAFVASGFQSQEPLKQLSFATTRTSTEKASDVWGWRFF
jgi:hypothetical protein